MSFIFTRIEHANELIVNHGLTKYISVIIESARKKSLPRLRDKDIIPQYFYEYLMYEESNFCPEVFASTHALKERVAARKKMAKRREEGEGGERRGEGCVHARRRLL